MELICERVVDWVCRNFFFSSRRRHTRCALVTGVQTCALPIVSDRSIDVIDAQPEMVEPKVSLGPRRAELAPQPLLHHLSITHIDQIGRASCRERVCQYV